MTYIKALLYPLVVCVALLVSQYELWCLDEYWSTTPDDASPPMAISCGSERGIALDERTDECPCLICSVIAPGDDDDDDD